MQAYIHQAAVSARGTARSPSAVRVRRTVMAFRVRVPVLSEQMTSQLPRVSTACSLRTMARLRLMRWTPRAMMMVTTAGIPSGMAATAMATAVMKVCIRG